MSSRDKHEDCIRGFTHYSESWYSKTNGAAGDGTIDELMIGMYDNEGQGTTGEFAVRWMTIGGEPTARLEVFDDSWDALLRFGDMLQAMATIDGQRVSPRAFADMLRSLGITDLTARERPTKLTPADVEYASWFVNQQAAA
jgi:hypothetical protein